MGRQAQRDVAAFDGQVLVPPDITRSTAIGFARDIIRYRQAERCVSITSIDDHDSNLVGWQWLAPDLDCVVLKRLVERARQSLPRVVDLRQAHADQSAIHLHKRGG